jgi:uncharacterized membrane protein YhhN
MLLTFSFLLLFSFLLYIRAIIEGIKLQIYVFKPLTTIIILCICLISLIYHPASSIYTIAITAGLFFSLLGDITLMLPFAKSLLLGMVFFLLAHLIYGTTFLYFSGFNPLDSISGLILIAPALVLYLYLLPDLKNLKLPVALYIVTISFMLWRAISTGFGNTFSCSQALFITVGAISFYLADTIEAYYRFKNQSLWIRPIYLSLYYLGQFLIALSTYSLVF